MRAIVDMYRLRTRKRSVYVVVGLVGLLLCGLYFGMRQFPAYWEQSLATCESEEIVPRLHRLIEMRPDGLSRVVASLGSERDQVSLGAVRVLNRHLTEWEKLPPHVGRAKLAILAEELSLGVEGFPPLMQYEAAKLAKRMLRWPPGPDSDAQTRLVSYCDDVLQAIESPKTLEQIATSRAQDVSRSDLTKMPERAPVHPASIEMPGGGLPIDLYDREHVLPEMEEKAAGEPLQPAGEATEVEARTRPQVAASLPGQIEAVAPGTHQSIEVRPEQSPVEEELPESLPNQPAKLTVDSDLLDLLWNRPQDIPSFELLRLAQIEDGSAADRAWNEIHARDIPVKFLELGLHLTDPDAAVRRRWVQRLPSLPGIDARPWLLALSNDEDAEVRMKALVLMATMGDPRILQRIEQLARDDREPQIQAQAQRILASQKK